MSKDTTTLTPAQESALWRVIGKPLWEPIKKVMPFVVAVVIGGGAVLYIRDQTSGVPENTKNTADAQPHIVMELKALNSGMEALKVDIAEFKSEVKTDIAVLKSQMTEMIKWKDRLESKEPK